MPKRYGSPPRDQVDRNPQLHNRLFILGGKEASEEEFRDAFSKYGTVQDVWIVKDRQNGENKGILPRISLRANSRLINIVV